MSKTEKKLMKQDKSLRTFPRKKTKQKENLILEPYSMT